MRWFLYRCKPCSCRAKKRSTEAQRGCAVTRRYRSQKIILALEFWTILNIIHCKPCIIAASGVIGTYRPQSKAGRCLKGSTASHEEVASIQAVVDVLESDDLWGRRLKRAAMSA